MDGKASQDPNSATHLSLYITCSHLAPLPYLPRPTRAQGIPESLQLIARTSTLGDSSLKFLSANLCQIECQAILRVRRWAPQLHRLRDKNGGDNSHFWED